MTDSIEGLLKLHLDEDSWIYRMLAEAIDRDVKQQVERYLAANLDNLHKVAPQINRYNEMQFHRVLQSVYGREVFKHETWLAETLNAWIDENTRLIKSIPEQYLGHVQALIAAASANGTSANVLAMQIRDSFKLPQSRAALIAVDQIGKLNGQLMRQRQQNIGIKQYRWRGRLDDRERDEHVRREGKVFSWDDPPSDGHPGQAIRCRCWAEMIYPAMEDLDAILFGDGGNRHYNEQMDKRGLTPLDGGAAVVDDPYRTYNYVPRGTK